MAWETFYGGEFPQRGRDHKEILVSITPAHIIRFNRNTHRALGETDAVMLKYDRLESLIGLEPVELDTEGSFRVKVFSKGRDFRINAASFCRNYGIRVERSERFLYPKVDPDGILRLDLKNTQHVSYRRPGPDNAEQR